MHQHIVASYHAHARARESTAEPKNSAMLRYSVLQSGAAGDPAPWILLLSKDTPVIGKRLRKSMPRPVITPAGTEFAPASQESGFTDAKHPSADPATLEDMAYLRESVRIRHFGSSINEKYGHVPPFIQRR
jgi:hypothetical protein